MITIYKQTHFEAAHSLAGHPKCGLLHGHSYKVEVWITGTPTGPWNFVTDFADIAAYFVKFDHADTVITKSTETLAMEACKHFSQRDNVSAVTVRIWDSFSAYAEATC